MLAFACYHCGLKLEVTDDLGGKQAKCPTCKSIICVPAPVAVAALAIPQDSIIGHPSGLARAGLTRAVGAAASQAATVAVDLREAGGPKPKTGLGGAARRSVRDILSQAKAGDERYLVEGELARGGMGVVRAAATSKC